MVRDLGADPAMAGRIANQAEFAVLPYDQMGDLAPFYSDTHATDLGAPTRVVALDCLKTKLRTDSDIALNVYPYHAEWDTNAQRVAGLDEWARQVEERFWELLDAETANRVAVEEPTAEEKERFSLEEMVDRLQRTFTGRDALLKQARDLANSPNDEDAPYGIVFTGESGAGKSALFAKLYTELSERDDLVLLSHAAEVSPRSVFIAHILRRWIGELAPITGDSPETPDDIKPEDLESLFERQLHRAARNGRIMVLVDGLNQLERTGRTKRVSWLPQAWPENARFIATTISGTETQVLGLRPRVELIELPPFSAKEIAEVAAQVYSRYHRTPNDAVVRILRDKQTAHGQPASGNALWLTTAVELVNLFDADDFTEAESRPEATPGERLQAHLRERATKLPVNLPGLIATYMGYVEKLAGARTFAALIALSRNGWREKDLIQLMPQVSPIFQGDDDQAAAPTGPFTSLTIALLRRSFRSQIAQRGELGQWVYTHRAFAEAIQHLLDQKWTQPPGETTRQQLHASVVEYLVTLPYDDPVRIDGLMFHLIGSDNREDAARYCIESCVHGQEVDDMSEHFGAVHSLADHVMNRIEERTNPGLEWVLSLLKLPHLTTYGRHLLWFTYHHTLVPALENRASLEVRLRLAQGTLACVEGLLREEPSSEFLQAGVCDSTHLVGTLHAADGDMLAALEAFRRGFDIAQEFVDNDTGSSEWAKRLYRCQLGLSDAGHSTGHLHPGEVVDPYAGVKVLLSTGKQGVEKLGVPLDSSRKGP